MENNESSTNCIRCGKTIAENGSRLCDECQAQGFKICENCGLRVSNGTTPYCDSCAEEIVGTG